MKIVILGSRNSSFTNALYNRITREHNVASVVLEEPTDRRIMLKRRIKRLGPGMVLGQLLFKVLIESILKRQAGKRIEEIVRGGRISLRSIPEEKIVRVSSVNSAESIAALKAMEPDIIFVMGTRIISEEVLKSVACRFVNMHMGITPLYRGVHGGYWALAENDREHCGVTLHLVDQGIDTGGVLAQAQIEPTKQDNFVTYPYLQLVAGLELVPVVIDRLKTDQLVVQQLDLPSKLRTHPTFLQYLKGYIQFGAK